MEPRIFIGENGTFARLLNCHKVIDVINEYFQNSKESASRIIENTKVKSVRSSLYICAMRVFECKGTAMTTTTVPYLKRF